MNLFLFNSGGYLFISLIANFINRQKILIFVPRKQIVLNEKENYT